MLRNKEVETWRPCTFHYYFDSSKKETLVQYKYNEKAELPYLPLAGGIKV